MQGLQGAGVTVHYNDGRSRSWSRTALVNDVALASHPEVCLFESSHGYGLECRLRRFHGQQLIRRPPPRRGCRGRLHEERPQVLVRLASAGQQQPLRQGGHKSVLEEHGDVVDDTLAGELAVGVEDDLNARGASVGLEVWSRARQGESRR